MKGKRGTDGAREEVMLRWHPVRCLVRASLSAACVRLLVLLSIRSQFCLLEKQTLSWHWVWLAEKLLLFFWCRDLFRDLQFRTVQRSLVFVKDSLQLVRFCSAADASSDNGAVCISGGACILPLGWTSTCCRCGLFHAFVCSLLCFHFLRPSVWAHEWITDCLPPGQVGRNFFGKKRAISQMWQLQKIMAC